MGKIYLEKMEEHLNKIKDEKFKKHIKTIIEELPDYITNMPSSTSGKYHPPDELDNDGMLLHIKRVSTCMDELVRMFKYNSKQADILYAGCILHDGLKKGLTEKKHTDEKHPIYIFDFIQQYIQKTFKAAPDTEMMTMLDDLASVCLFHSGIWTPAGANEKFRCYHIKMDPGTKDLCKTMHIADCVMCKRSIYDVMVNKGLLK